MKYAIALFVISFAAFAIPAQVPGEPPISVDPPSIDELPGRTNSKPTPIPDSGEPRLQPVPVEDQPIVIEPPVFRKPVTRVEPSRREIEPVRGSDEPVVPGIRPSDPVPVLPIPGDGQGPFEAPIPAGEPFSVLPREETYRPLYLDLQTINFLIPGADSLFGQTQPPGRGWVDTDLFQYRVTPNSAFQLDGLFRGYYRNDQRIQWSGVEATFGGEGVLRPSFVSRTGDWIVSTQAELFLNSHYGSSILSDPTRDLYRSNFNVETFQIFQMFVEASYEDWSFRFGRSRTPFGRYQSPMFSNSMQDSQFLRSEVIGFQETGIFVHYKPGPLVVDLALVNGEPELDTNSSKALVTRWGFEEDFWTVGASVKFQDGVSSEFQKRFNNIYGVDGSVALGRFLIYGEAVIDTHGFLRDASNNPDYNPYNLGIRSLYGRDVFKADEDTIQGKGAYLGVTYRADTWLVDLSYGRYIPENIGVPGHDKPTNRFLLKTAYTAARNLQVYLSFLAENKRFTEGLLSNSSPYAAWFGMQYGF